MPTISSASSFVAEALFSPNVQDNEAAARRSERPQLSQDDVLKPTVTAPPCVRFVRQHSEPIYVCEARPGRVRLLRSYLERSNDGPGQDMLDPASRNRERWEL